MKRRSFLFPLACLAALGAAHCGDSTSNNNNGGGDGGNNPPPGGGCPAGMSGGSGSLGAWAVTPSGTMEDLKEVWGTAANNVYAVNALEVRRFNGMMWVGGPTPPEIEADSQHRGGPPALESVGGFDMSSVFLGANTIPPEGSAEVGRALIIKVMGTTGTPSFPEPRGVTKGFWGFAANDIWAVGGDYALHWNGMRWESRSAGIPRNSDLQAVWGASPTDIRAVGVGVFKWNMGTSMWEAENVPAVGSSGFLSIWGSGANDVWLVGRSAAQHWNGQTWKRFFTGTTESLYGVYGFAANDVWAVGDRGAVTHWNGAAWSVVPSNTQNGLRGIWGSSARDIWAVGDRGTIVHYTGGMGNGGGPSNTDLCASAVGDGRGLRIAAANASACARKGDGTVACWGDNAARQLGDGTTTTRYEPTTVMGLTDVTQVTIGRFHACAVKTDGTVWCWGTGRSGQLGDGMNVDHPTPTQVSNLMDAAQVAVGNAHSCAVRRNGNITCWGQNDSGQIGDGTNSNRQFPATTSTPIADMVTVAAGLSHTCGLRANGSVVCWGANSAGQLGVGNTTPSPMGLTVPGIADALSLASGTSHTCAVRVNGQVLCWGGNMFGQLGNGTTTNSASPIAVMGLSDAVAVATGANHTCAVRRTGAVMCWGVNTAGQLGDGTTMNRTTPVAVTGITDGALVAAGNDFSCVVRGGGTATCWGNNINGQLGRGMTMGSSAQQPAPVNGL